MNASNPLHWKGLVSYTPTWGALEKLLWFVLLKIILWIPVQLGIQESRKTAMNS